MYCRPVVLKACCVCLLLLSSGLYAADPQETQALFQSDNLVAWCIVPFDAKQRGPIERAEMLNRLGISKVAYDWREQHVESFEKEILAYQKHKIEFFAFWSWHPAMEPLIEKYGIRPQLWKTAPSPKADTQQERVATAAKQLLPLVQKAKELKLKFGLYNHGGWGGEPENLIAVCKYLHEQEQATHVGIVYNLHHGHSHIDDFDTVLPQLQPYLLCLNLNGMNAEAKPKILPIGQGEFDRKLIHTILASSYQGPIGILDHRPELDAERSLRENLEGLENMVPHK